MSERTSTIRSRELGHQLRFYREDSGLTQQFAARRIGLSTASMCRIEDGTKPPTSEQVCALLALYNVTGPKREALMVIAREVNERGWWQKHNPELGDTLQTLRSQEERACTITSHQVTLIPGLLQVPEYVEALMRSSSCVPEEQVSAQVRARLGRRHILFRDEPVHFCAFISEMALRRAYGSAAVQHRQLHYLLKMMERPNIIIRIVPIDGIDITSIGSFLLFRFPASPAIAHVETANSELFFEEPDDITYYDDAVHGLMRSALDTGESAGLITRLMRKLEEDPDVLPELARPHLAEE